MRNKREIFSNIIGYDDTKKTLRRIVDVLNNKEKYKNIGCTMPHGLLLYGPPGLGKTTFVKEILKYVENIKTYTVRKTKSDGLFISVLKNVFEEAIRKQPAIILLDDMDKYAESNKSYVNNEEFVAVQSLIDSVKDEDVFVMATANDIDVLPKSLLREGRFDIRISIDYPDEDESYEIIKHYLKNKKIDKDVNVKNISYILSCKSCATIEKVCNQAGIYSAYNNKEKIGMEELLRASLESSYDACIEDMNKDDLYDLETAYHEAGHALIGEYLEPDSVSFITTINTYSDTKGFTKSHKNKYSNADVKFKENSIMRCLAGKAATEIVFNKCDVGVFSDLDKAYTTASNLVDAYCMFDFNSWFRSRDQSSEKVKQSKDDAINKLITDYYNKAKEILIANRNKLDVLAKTLDKKKILFQDEIKDIYNNPDKYIS